MAGSLIMSAQVAVGLPLVVQAEIRPDGQIVTRCYEWQRTDNTYWHIAEFDETEIEEGRFVLSRAQRESIVRLWAGEHGYRKEHANGVGASLLRAANVDHAGMAKILGHMPALA